MPKLPTRPEPLMKNNVLPFPALQAAPRDKRKPSVWRSLLALVVFGVAIMLVWTMILAFIS